MMHWPWWFFGFVVVAILALGYYGSVLITGVPFLPVPYTPKDFGWPFEEVSFFSSDGLRLKGWFIPSGHESPVTIIVQHGVGSNHGDMLLNTACLRNQGHWNLLYYNFRGHQGSEGTATSLGPLELLDLEGALAYLKKNKPQASRHIGLYGHSLGAAVALVGATRFKEIEAVAAESSFANLSKTVARFSRMFHGIPVFPFVPLAIGFASWRLGTRIWKFDPVKVIGQLSPRPVLLIQAERDIRAPLSDAKELWAAAGEPKDLWVAPGAGHGDPWMLNKEEYEKRLVGFFRKAFT